MSTDLVRRDELTSLSIPEMQSVANLLAQSGFFTDKKNAAQVFVAVLAGQELGIPPFAAINGVHVIQGKPSVGAGLLAAMVKQSGKYDYQVKRLDDEGCTLHFFQNGAGAGSSTFTIKDAERAGLTRNPTWKQYPQNMLFARALSNGVRWYCPDVTHGAHFDADPDSPPESTPRPQASPSSPEPDAAAPASPVTETVVDAEVLPVQPEPVPVAPTPDDTPNGLDGEAAAAMTPAEVASGILTPQARPLPAPPTARALADVKAQFKALSQAERDELRGLMEAHGIGSTPELIAAMESRGILTLDGLMRHFQQAEDFQASVDTNTTDGSLQGAMDTQNLALPDGATLEDHPHIPGQVEMPDTAGKGRRKLTPRAAS